MTPTAGEIPNRALYRAGEVCQIAQVQSFVLRSWEAEFPDLGVAKTGRGPRVYRRFDLERVLRIKHLLFVEGLTLGAARRRLEGEAAPVGGDAGTSLEELFGRDARDRLTEVKQGLQSILQMLSGNGEPASGRQARRARRKPKRLAGAVRSRRAVRAAKRKRKGKRH